MPIYDTGVAPDAGLIVLTAASVAAMGSGSADGDRAEVVAAATLQQSMKWYVDPDGKSDLWLPAHWYADGDPPDLIRDSSSNPCSVDASVDTKAGLAAAGFTVGEDANSTVTLNAGTFELRSGSPGSTYAYFRFDLPIWTTQKIALAMELQMVTGTLPGQVYIYVGDDVAGEMVSVLPGVGTAGYMRMGTTSASTAKGLCDIGTAGHVWVFAEFDFSFLQGACRAWQAEGSTGQQTLTESQNGSAFGGVNEIAAVTHYASGVGGAINLKQFRAFELAA
jgi:hypothetical protein